MYYWFLLGKVLTSIVPRWFAYLFAKSLALIHYYTSKKDREAVLCNLAYVMGPETGPKKLKRAVKNVFINFSYYLVDFFRFSRVDKKFIEKYVAIEGLENLELSLAKNRGVILLAAHLGNYELGAAVVSLLGYPFTAVVLSHKDKRVNNFFDNQRALVGVEVIPTGGAIKGCFSALKQGKAIALVADREFGDSGLKMNLFSKPAILPKGAAFFALRMESVIVPTFLVRENKYYYRFFFDKPIDITEEGFTKDQDVINSYIPVLEKYIKRYPDQWYAFQKYWLEDK